MVKIGATLLVNPIEYIPRFLKILSKADDKSISRLIPMDLLPMQLDYIKNSTNRDVILKGRQMGSSTGVMARNAHIFFTRPYVKGAIVAHNMDVAEFLFQTIKRFHRNLPVEIRPEANLNSMSRIYFPELDTFVHIDSAESRAIGFGETLNIAHLSEVSRWPPNMAKELFAGITQTVPQGGLVTVESTPRGRGGLFYELYDGAKRGDNGYKAFFYPWWWDPGYKKPIPDGFKLTPEEEQMVNHYKLTPEQIEWRRNKQTEIGDLFYQEYPENDVDCWLSSEQAVFDSIAIRQYLQEVLPGRQESNNLTIWKDTIGGERYVIGVDVASGQAKGDYSVAAVLNVKRNEYVACLRGRLPPDIFAQEVLRLGRRYNDAEIGVEITGHGHMVLNVLIQSNYPNIYHHEEYDDIVKEYVSLRPGWKTSVRSKPIMIDTMSLAIRARDLILWSENFCLEASNLMWDGAIGVKTKTPSGAHDDELMALMIALQLRANTPIAPLNEYIPISYARIR